MIARHAVIDPMYEMAAIEADPLWALAFRLSEVDNDHAPLGWGRYIPLAVWLRQTYDLQVRPPSRRRHHDRRSPYDD